MNGTQVGDIFHRLSACKEFGLEYVKVLFVGDKEYAVLECDENGGEYKRSSPRYIQKHVFIEQYEKVRKPK